MNYKKPAFWIIAVLLIACIVVAVCILTNPRTETDAEEEVVSDETIETDARYFKYSHAMGLNGVVITEYTGKDTVVSIPHSIDGEPVVKIDDNAFHNCWGLTRVIIPDSVTYIGEYAFAGCWDLRDVTVPDSVTHIGMGAFDDCKNLESIEIPANLTEIDEFVFFGCSNLSDVTIPDTVTTIGQFAFYGCDGFTNIVIPEGVISIDGFAFADCSSLAKVTLPDSLMSIGDGVFQYCAGLKTLTIPDHISYIGLHAFDGCDALMVSYNGKVYDDSNNDSADFEELYSLFNEDEIDVLARFREADWEEVRNLPYKEYYDVTDWSGIVCIGDLSEYGIRIYGYNDDEITGQGVAVEMPDMGDTAGNISYFDWNYITPRMILPDFYWDDEHAQLQCSFHIYTGTGYDADMLAVLQYDGTGTLQPSIYDYEGYMNMLMDRVDYSYNKDTGELILVDHETNEEIFTVVPEEAVIALAWGDISGFELGDTIIFSVTPGYIVDGAAIPQYDNMPTLEFKININPTVDGDLLFEIGELIKAEVEP